MKTTLKDNTVFECVQSGNYPDSKCQLQTGLADYLYINTVWYKYDRYHPFDHKLLYDVFTLATEFTSNELLELLSDNLMSKEAELEYYAKLHNDNL